MSDHSHQHLTLDDAVRIGAPVDAAGPCAVCPHRARCIRYGWVSPGGYWFADVLVIEPRDGCRGHEASRREIERRFRPS